MIHLSVFVVCCFFVVLFFCLFVFVFFFVVGFCQFLLRHRNSGLGMSGCAIHAFVNKGQRVDMTQKVPWINLKTKWQGKKRF